MNTNSIAFDSVLYGLRASTKNQILQNMSWKISRQTGVDMTWMADQLIACESRENSAIGDGVAIAHLKSSPLQKPFLMLARLDTAIDFDAADAQPVDLVCILVSGQIDDLMHLQRLSRVTRLFRNLELLGRLRDSANETQMRTALQTTAKPDELQSFAA